MLEITLALLSPSPFLQDALFTTDYSYFLEEVEYRVNEFLILPQFLRIYLVFRFALNFSQFSSARVLRISKMMGTSVQSMFILKSIHNTYPYLSLMLLFNGSAVFFAFALKIVESPVYYMDYELVEKSVDYRYLENCIWNIMVSMTSVGYGDYYPSTNFGRMIIMGASLAGNAFIALFVFSLERTFKLNTHEANAFEFSQRLAYKMKMEEESAKLFFETFKFVHAKNKYIEGKVQAKKGEIQDKRNIKKSLMRKIKEKKVFRQQYQFFRNNFDRYSVTDLIKLKMDDLMRNLKEIKQKTGGIDKRMKKMEEEKRKMLKEAELNKKKLVECQKTIKHVMSTRFEGQSEIYLGHSRRSSLLFNDTLIDDYEGINIEECNEDLKEAINKNWK